MARQVQTREQLTAEVAALRLRVRELEARHSEEQPSPRGEGVISVDSRGRITMCNTAAAVLTGWSPDDAQSRSVDEILCIDDEFGPGLVRGTLHDGAARHLESAWLRRDDDSLVEASVSVLPVTDRGSTVGAIITLQARDGSDPVADAAHRGLVALRAIADAPWPVDNVTAASTVRDVLESIMNAVEADRAVVTLADDAATTIAFPEESLSFTGGVATGLDVADAGVGNDPSPLAQSLMALPLRTRGRTVGMLSLSSHAPNHFDPERTRTLGTLANVLAMAIDGSRQEEQIRSGEALLDAVHAITEIGASRAIAGEKVARITQLAAWAGRASVAGVRIEQGADAGSWVSQAGHAAPTQELLARFDALCEADGNAPWTASPGHAGWPEGLPEGQATIFPILNGPRRVGVFLMVTPSTMAGRAHRVMSGAADVLGMVLEIATTSAQVTENQLREQEQLAVFREAAAQLAIAPHPETVLEHLVSAAAGLTGAEAGCVAIWDADGSTRTVISAGEPGAAALGQALDQSRNALIEASLPSIRFASDPVATESLELRSLLGVPFARRGGPPGAVVLFNKRGRAFTAENERVLELFSTMAAILFDNMGLFESVERDRLILEALQDSMDEGLLVLDASGAIAFSNPAAHRLLAPEGGELHSRSLRDLLRGRKGDFAEPETLSEILRALKGSGTTRCVEARLLNPSPADLTFAIFPIEVSAEERLTGVLLRDVTDERELERRRDNFVSVASHELRTPMTTILGFSELLLSGDGRGPRRRKWLEHIHQGSQRVVSIVDDLLNVSRIQSGNMSLRLQQLPVPGALERAVSPLRMGLDTHTIDVTVPDDELPLAWADGDKLHQVITNLVTNAIKYSPKGGTVRVAASLDAPGRFVQVSVSDDGIGIAKADQRRLFQSFQRSERPETRGIPGTGLGLYVVKGLIELMGGEVGVSSKLGKGSTFWFSLPIDEPQIAAVEPAIEGVTR